MADVIIGNSMTAGATYGNSDVGITLNKGQQAALDSMLSGKDVFITGVAGTGKSTVVREFIRRATEKGYHVIVTAPTGVAAANVGGVTLHSQFQLSGVLEPNFYFPRYRERMQDNFEARWAAIEDMNILILEEVSMIRYDYFERIMKIVYGLRESGHHVQVVASGDFGQLAPILVFNRGDKKGGMSEGDVFRSMFPHVGREPWAFLSDLWNFDTYELKQVMRQSDEEFVKALSKIRLGDYTGIDYINAHCAKEPQDDAVFLCGTNKDVDTLNNICLDSIKEPLYEFRADITGEATISDVLIDDPLRLKVGANVMTVVNNSDGGYQNGTFGVVERVYYLSDVPYVDVRLCSGRLVSVSPYTWEINAYERNYDGEFKKVVIGKVTGMPLKLRYAITAHKSQGQTFDSAIYYMPYCFSPGQLYVALSRVRSLSGLYIPNPIPYKCLITSQHVVEFYGDIYGYSNLRHNRRLAFEQAERDRIARIEQEHRNLLRQNGGISFTYQNSF